MNAWLQTTRRSCAVGIYISGDSRACRNQPNLTATWVSTQLAQGLAAAADHARPAGVLPAALPALRGRLQDQPEARQGTTATASPSGQGTTEAASRWPRRRRSASSPGSTLWYDLEGFNLNDTHCRESALSFLSGWTTQVRDARLRVRRLLQRRLRHQDARRRPGQPARQVRAARPDLDRPLGRHRQHLHVLHPQRRLASRRPGEAVPGRPRRDLGRRHDQHRQQLPRRRPGLGRERRDPLRRHPDRLLALRRPARRHDVGDTRRRPTRSRPCSACSRSRASTPASSAATSTPSCSAAVNAWQTPDGIPGAARSGHARTG